MKLSLSRIKNRKKSKLISYFLLFVIIVYSLTFAILYFSVSIALIHTINSIRIPDNYILINLDPLNPHLKLPFTVTNKGHFELSKFRINVSINIMYYTISNNTKVEREIFMNCQDFKDVGPKQKFSAIFEGNAIYFEIYALEDYWANANFSSEIIYFFNIKITGKYFLNLIPFKIEINNLSLICSDCL